MRKRRSFESQLMNLSLSASLPLLLLLIWVMIYASISIFLILLTGLIGSLLVIYSISKIHQNAAYQFRSLSNLLEAMIHGDYSLRARSDAIGNNQSALIELVDSINGLAKRLSKQRLESIEGQFLLRTVIDHIDVAIVALNPMGETNFMNPAAKKLLLSNAASNNTKSVKLIKQLDFAKLLSSGSHQIIELSLGGQKGKFNIHIEEYRDLGKQHKLLFITDVRTILRSEERKAWKNLVRVISHEINNSLTPIASLSQTLKRVISRQDIEFEIKEDLTTGLSIIAERADSLKQFVGSYQQLAKLPEPKKQVTSIRDLLKKVTALFEDTKFVTNAKIDAEIYIDPVQFEQVLINLIKNAVESMQQINSDDEIEIDVVVDDKYFKLSVCDRGGGISNPDNLFVPFYSTKQHGSGIGLVLCRQVVEAHNGNLTLTNRSDTKGCIAVIEILI